MIFVSKALKQVFNLFPERLHVPILGGVMRGVFWVPKSANPGQVFGRYEPDQERAMIELLRESEVFWDVGAHVGWYSLLAAKFMRVDSKIVCFEPNPKNIKFIKKHILINNATNIKLLPVAMSSSVGKRNFSGGAQQGKLNDDGNQTVTTTSADEIVRIEGVAPDLLKVDIEGAETDFLKGAERLFTDYKPTILLSAHGYRKRDSCVAYFVDKGYEIEHLVSNDYEGDYVFVARFR